MVVSCSFLEVGQSFLSDRVAWMTPAIIRSKALHDVQGGWSKALSVFLEHLLTGPLGFSTVGSAVELDNGPVVIYAKLAVLLTDGEGWYRVEFNVAITRHSCIAKVHNNGRARWPHCRQKCYDWRGHGSLKPCFRHPNVFRKVHGQLYNFTEWLISHDSAEHRFHRLSMSVPNSHVWLTIGPS